MYFLRFLNNIDIFYIFLSESLIAYANYKLELSILNFSDYIFYNIFIEFIYYFI